MTDRLKTLLDTYAVNYERIPHSPAFTAEQVAASAHVVGRNFAKTVIVKIDGAPVMLVLPATRRLLLPELREMFISDDVDLATEAEIRGLFPDCELGAMPPFGNLYGMEVHVSALLTDEDEIVFNAGTHTEVVKMKYADFDRLVRPRVIDFVTT